MHYERTPLLKAMGEEPGGDFALKSTDKKTAFMSDNGYYVK
jgi:hypothetical protein